MTADQQKTEKYFWQKCFNWLMRHEDIRGRFQSSVYHWNPHYNIIEFWMFGENWKLYQPYKDTGLGPVLLHIESYEWQEVHTRKEFRAVLKEKIKKLADER